jgi:hypothetical protein
MQEPSRNGSAHSPPEFGMLLPSVVIDRGGSLSRFVPASPLFRTRRRTDQCLKTVWK